MRARTIGLVALALGLFASIQGCGTTINPGRVGIVVNRFGKNRGVQDYTTTTGYVMYNPITTSVIEYPTSVQTVQWTANKLEGNPQDESITFTTKESVSVNADISLSYLLDVPKIPAFYVKFRNDDLNQFTYGFLHNVARDAMMEIGGRYTVEQVMGDNERFLHEVRDRIQDQVSDIGVQIQQFGFIGAPRPPQQVIDSINAAQQAKYIAQQKQNELLQTQADVAKRIADAEGTAKANDIINRSISDNLLRKQALDIQWNWVQHWDGKGPMTIVGGQGGGSVLFNLPAGR